LKKKERHLSSGSSYLRLGKARAGCWKRIDYGSKKEEGGEIKRAFPKELHRSITTRGSKKTFSENIDLRWRGDTMNGEREGTSKGWPGRSSLGNRAPPIV